MNLKILFSTGSLLLHYAYFLELKMKSVWILLPLLVLQIQAKYYLIETKGKPNFEFVDFSV